MAETDTVAGIVERVSMYGVRLKGSERWYNWYDGQRPQAQLGVGAQVILRLDDKGKLVGVREHDARQAMPQLPDLDDVSPSKVERPMGTGDISELEQFVNDPRVRRSSALHAASRFFAGRHDATVMHMIFAASVFSEWIEEGGFSDSIKGKLERVQNAIEERERQREKRYSREFAETVGAVRQEQASVAEQPVASASNNEPAGTIHATRAEIIAAYQVLVAQATEIGVPDVKVFESDVPTETVLSEGKRLKDAIKAAVAVIDQEAVPA